MQAVVEITEFGIDMDKLILRLLGANERGEWPARRHLDFTAKRFSVDRALLYSLRVL